jgi:hypothetical protein
MTKQPRPPTQKIEPPGGGNEDVTSGIMLWPWRVLQEARRAVPAVDYALGAAGVAAAGAIVTYMIGKDKASIIIFGGMLVAMVLLFIFARLVVAKSTAATTAGIVLLWAVTVFFCTFLFFTAAAFAFHWPPAWADFLGLRAAPTDTSTNCAPVLNDDGHIGEKCGLSVVEARAAARNTVGKIINKVALVLSQKEVRLFPRMRDYLNETNEARREEIWSDVQEATAGPTGLLTIISSASTAILDLDTRLRTQAGAELAHDPTAVRQILETIQTKALNPRQDISKEIVKNKKPTNEMVRQWYNDLQPLVSGLESDFHQLEQELLKPV